MKLFLMRHGQPVSDGAKRCIGVTDVLLSESGRERAYIVAEALKPFQINKIYTSPLQRCISTAEIVKDTLGLSDFEIVNDLHEINMGEWDGRTFEEIQECWPEAYRERGHSIGTYIVRDGESFAQAGERFELAVSEISNKAAKDVNVLIIGHAGVIRGYFCRLLGLSPDDVLKLPMPYGGISMVDAETFQVEQIGVLPSNCLNDREIKVLYTKYQVPENIIRHMQTTADFIGNLSEKIRGDFDWQMLKKAALVHDLARTQPHHDLKTADILRTAGYDTISRWVAAHHGRNDLPEMITPLIFPEKSIFDQIGMIGDFSPSELLFYADKRVQEDHVVSIDERFMTSAFKCKTLKAKAKHRQLYLMAKNIEEKLTNVLQP